MSVTGRGQIVLLLTLLCLAAGPAWASAEPARQRVAGQGLGEAPGAPLGQPVNLKLPAGYTLIGLRGGATLDYIVNCYGEPEARSRPQCSAALGGFDVTLVLRFDAARYVPGQDSNRAACADEPVWGSWILESADGEAQNLLVPVAHCQAVDGGRTPLLTLPPPTGEATVEFTIGGYCLNLSRDVPGDEATFRTGVITGDAGLIEIVNAIRLKDLYLGDNQDVIQDVIWDYTDFGELDAESFARLAALP